MLFSDFIRDYRAGVLDEVLGKQLQKAIEATSTSFRPSQLNIGVKLKTKNMGEMALAIKHTTKLPENDTMESIMFVTPENNLINNDPKQHDFFNGTVRTIDDKEYAIKEV